MVNSLEDFQQAYELSQYFLPVTIPRQGAEEKTEIEIEIEIERRREEAWCVDKPRAGR
jgi:hypothetical protein